MYGMSRRLRARPWPGFSLLLISLLPGCVTQPAATLTICRLDPGLELEVRRTLQQIGPRVDAGIWLARPGCEPLFACNVDAPLPCASSIKTAYLVELFAEFSDDLDVAFPGVQTILADPQHPAVAHFSAAQRATAQEHLGDASVRRVAEAMMTGRGVDNATYNIAANLVTAHCGGPAALTRSLHDRDPGWRGLQVRRYMLADRTTNGDNAATARSLAAVLEQLALGMAPGVTASAIDAARQIMARDPRGDRQRFTKGGSLNSNPVTRVRSGFRTGPSGTVVWVIMLAQQVDPDDRSAAGPRLAGATEAIEQLLLDAAP